jgi:hypothetical protein
MAVCHLQVQRNKSGSLAGRNTQKDGHTSHQSYRPTFAGCPTHLENPKGWNVIYRMVTLKLNLEVFEIEEYKECFKENHGSVEWKKSVLADLQSRLENKVPT